MNTQCETSRLSIRILTAREAPLVQSFYERNLYDFSKY